MVYLQYGKSILRQSKILKDRCENVLHHPLLYAGQGVRYRKLEVILATVSLYHLYKPLFICLICVNFSPF